MQNPRNGPYLEVERDRNEKDGAGPPQVGRTGQPKHAFTVSGIANEGKRCEAVAANYELRASCFESEDFCSELFDSEFLDSDVFESELFFGFALVEEGEASLDSPLELESDPFLDRESVA